MPGVFELLKRGWDIYRKNIRAFFVYIGIVFALALGIEILNMLYGPTEGTLIARNWDEVASFSLLILPVLLALFYAGLAFFVAMYRRMQDKSAEPKEAFTIAGKRFLPSLAAYIIASFLLWIGGGIASSQMIKFLPGAPSASELSDVISIVIVVFAIICLVIPGMILSIWFMFGQFETLLAERAPFAALRESYRLVHHRFWRVLWITFATTVVISALGYLIGDIVELIAVKGALKLFTESAGAGAIGKTVVETLVGSLIAPWGYAMTLYLYQALKESQSAA